MITKSRHKLTFTASTATHDLLSINNYLMKSIIKQSAKHIIQINNGKIRIPRNEKSHVNINVIVPVNV